MKQLIKIILFLAMVAVMAAPFFYWWPGASTSLNLPFSASLYLALFFPLFGMLALNLLWIQFMVGAWRSMLNSLFDPAKVLRYHIREGIIAYGIALIHPFLLYLSIKVVGLSYFGVLSSLPDSLKLYWSAGILAFLLLTFATLAGLLRKNKFVVRHWKKVHYFTYLALPLILYHSWNIGSHVQSTTYKYFWWVFTISFILTALVRLVHHIKKYHLTRQAKVEPINPP
ncbi:TPA: hypothetical protein DIC39_01180 [Patescibacteria group bacterium]|nr:hypothetical protein [Patescibacteria group bacterium]HCU47660.1 hypothetical protein [Patescibacteria group bacterium]